jgi:hypothetical protein
VTSIRTVAATTPIFLLLDLNKFHCFIGADGCQPGTGCNVKYDFAYISGMQQKLQQWVSEFWIELYMTGYLH